MKEYVENFYLQLQDHNFEANENKTIWTGSIHVEWEDTETGKEYSTDHHIKICLLDGFPFNAPIIFSVDDPPLKQSWHLDAGTPPTLCLWDRERVWKPTFSAQKLLHRIEDWFYYYHTNLWPSNSQVPDLHAYLSKIGTAVIGNLWQPCPDKEWGRFKLWFSPKFFNVSPVIAISDDTFSEPEKRLARILTGTDIKSELGIWFRVPEPFVPSSNLKALSFDIDRLLSKEKEWSFPKIIHVVGSRRKHIVDGFPIAIAYPDHTHSERYLFLWIQFPKERSKKFNWAKPTNLPQITVRSFQTAPAATIDLLRRSDYISNDLTNKIITIFGVGALGGSTALLLAKAGVGEIRLIDNDILMPGNVMRHACGLNWVGSSKATAIRYVIQSHSPDCIVKIYDTSWKQNELIEYIAGTDIIVDATGNQNFSHHLSQLCIHQNQSILIAAAYRRARVGRIIIWRSENDPCHGCYTLTNYTWPESAYPLIPANPNEEFIEDGCGTATEEAVALDVEAVANFVARTVIKILRDEFGEDNIGIVVNEPIPDATLPVFHSVGIHWWKNQSVPKCPLCDREGI